jgi:hypothetical protein
MAFTLSLDPIPDAVSADVALARDAAAPARRTSGCASQARLRREGALPTARALAAAPAVLL